MGGWRTARCMWRSAVTLEGHKEVLGLWTSANEGAKFWLQVLTELNNRGVKDIFIACVDGLKGFPQAIETVFPKTMVQLCIVHMVRASLNYVNWKERQQVVAGPEDDLPRRDRGRGGRQLDSFAESGIAKYPTIAALVAAQLAGDRTVLPVPRRGPQDHLHDQRDREPEHESAQGDQDPRSAFPSEDAALKVMYLALRNLSAKWQHIQGWRDALSRFVVLWEARFPQHHRQSTN